MTIDEIRIRRQLAEAQILLSLAQFKAETGLAIVACDVRTFTAHSMNRTIAETITSGVSLTVESI